MYVASIFRGPPQACLAATQRLYLAGVQPSALALPVVDAGDAAAMR